MQELNLWLYEPSEPPVKPLEITAAHTAPKCQKSFLLSKLDWGFLGGFHYCSNSKWELGSVRRLFERLDIIRGYLVLLLGTHNVPTDCDWHAGLWTRTKHICLLLALACFPIIILPLSISHILFNALPVIPLSNSFRSFLVRYKEVKTWVWPQNYTPLFNNSCLKHRSCDYARYK